VNEQSLTAEIVLAAFAAVERRDEPGLQALCHRDVTFHWPPAVREARPGQTWEEIWDPLQPTALERAMSPRLVASSAHEAAVLWHQHGLDLDGRRLDAEVLGLYEVRDERFFRAQMFYFDTITVLRFLRGARDGGGS
jgi:ketosteroid isomerase-like protein